MPSDDEKQHPSGRRSLGTRMRSRTWWRSIASARRHAEGERQIVASPPHQLDVHAALHALPALLDCSSLPNGVVELLIEDLEAPTRQLFDVHDGRVTLVEPGKCVPWACIAGPATAWAMALGPERNTTALQLTGDEQLARRVLAAFPPRVQ